MCGRNKYVEANSVSFWLESLVQYNNTSCPDCPQVQHQFCNQYDTVIDLKSWWIFAEARPRHSAIPSGNIHRH
jgi:hypothetical protein